MRLQRILAAALSGGEAGQATAFFVCTVLIIVGFMAFAFDTGFLYHARRVNQNAVDPAVLAGAAELPGCGDQDPEPLDEAAHYIEKNLEFATLSSSDDAPVLSHGTFTVGATDFPTVYASTNRNQNTSFSAAFGLGSADVPAEAEAACLPIDRVAICPFYIQAPDEGSGDEEHFGLEIADIDNGVYPIYRFKFSAQDGEHGNRGFLGIYGSGAAQIRNGIEAGCVDPDGELDYVVSQGGLEGEPSEVITDSQPGTISSVWASFDELYEYEEDRYGDEFWCDIEFDHTDFPDDAPYYYTVDTTDPDAAAERIRQCKWDPRGTDDNVYGRYFPIVITEALIATGCHGNCEITTDHIAMMYVVCWGSRCDGGNGNGNGGGGGNGNGGGGNGNGGSGGGGNGGGSSGTGQSSLYGIFIEDYPFQVQGSGISDNPLAPKRPLLIR
jgi:hypothetical protein